MRKRSAYRPKAKVLPVLFRHSEADDRQLQLVPHAELEKFRHGLGDEVSINTLAFRLNFGYVLAREFFESAALTEVLTNGLNALRSVIERKQRTGKVGAMMPEFEAMGEALVHTDQMQLKCTRKEMNEAIMKVINEAALDAKELKL